MNTSEQAKALQQSAGVRVRDDLQVVRVRGDDAVGWLNGQVTNDVRNLAESGPVYGLAVNVRGKIMADLWVLPDDPDVLVLLPERATDTVLASFDAQIIMEDVELERVPELRVISVQGPQAMRCARDAGVPGSELHACDELGSGGVFVVCGQQQQQSRHAALNDAARALGGGAVDDAGFELARLRAGRPRFGKDFDERHYPQEAGLKERAVSFQKGCYLGQEVVCTLENRGKLRRRLTQLWGEGHEPLEPGAHLTDTQGAEVGELTSVAHDSDSGRWLALGYLKTAARSAGNVVQADGQPLHVTHDD